MSKIVDFYSGGTDIKGRTLIDILGWGDEKLEKTHDYIQWLFPLNEDSAYNDKAPVLTEEDIETFKNDSSIRIRAVQSIIRILKFYGFKAANKGGVLAIEETNDTPRKLGYWLRPKNHNFLRLTRIIKFLQLIDMSHIAFPLYTKLLYLAVSRPDIFGTSFEEGSTVWYWTKAMLGESDELKKG